MRNMIDTYRDSIQFYLGIDYVQEGLDGPIENGILMVAPLYVPIADLKKSIFVKSIKYSKGRLFVTCELPEFVDVSAFIRSEYSKICTRVFQLYWHDGHITDVMTINQEFKRTLIESFIVDKRTYASEYDKFNEMIKELDSRITPEDEYYSTT